MPYLLRDFFAAERKELPVLLERRMRCLLTGSRPRRTHSTAADGPGLAAADSSAASLTTHRAVAAS